MPARRVRPVGSSACLSWLAATVLGGASPAAAPEMSAGRDGSTA
jgi:hypothetical protein